MADEMQSAGGGNADGQGKPAGNVRSSAPGLLGKGSFHLFRMAGIDVSLHWTWFLVAFYQISMRENEYRSPVWKVYEYLALFGIVLMHEFGHAFACRQTGGKSDHIMLWPLGGVAFVQPPPRPGALLWSIAAGPLVNVFLLPVTWGFYKYGIASSWAPEAPDFLHWAYNIARINLILLVFNMLPVYPLDGGQIVRALLWFAIGRSMSLLVVAVIGFVAGVGTVGAAFYYDQMWFVVIGGFMLQRSAMAFQYARSLRRTEKVPRIEGLACPECGEKPFAGEVWACDACKTRFNPFVTGKTCPGCGKVHEKVQCPFCNKWSEEERWVRRGELITHERSRR